ncbi:hypothetical protein [Jiulongibacter sediminis]|jgi:hypothetical protein|uniref:hypothetical protein n=1 Tax=Jiulongibacter sediminis TaxID=1605367 RepID=UPI0026EAD2A2|nr:hypothetical protein [Jiulongibacter sediminis]
MKKGLSLFFAVGIWLFSQCKTIQNSSVSDGKDPESGLMMDQNLMLVKSQCTACHSAKLITMNRFTRTGWKEKIVWMQKTQNLWDLGESEPAVLDYLEKYYSPEPQASRRKNLEDIEWHKLED